MPVSVVGKENKRGIIVLFIFWTTGKLLCPQAFHQSKKPGSRSGQNNFPRFQEYHSFRESLEYTGDYAGVYWSSFYFLYFKYEIKIRGVYWSSFYFLYFKYEIRIRIAGNHCIFAIFDVFRAHCWNSVLQLQFYEVIVPCRWYRGNCND